MLIYHRVGGGSDSGVDLELAVFDRQMQYLRDHCRVLSMDEAAFALSFPTQTGAAAERAVVVTFDDGTADFAEHAAPILHQYGIPATLYLATEFVDSQREFPWGAPPLSWEEIQNVSQSGLITIGSHTHAHCLLDRIPLAAACADLDRSIAAIQANTGRIPSHFAAPKAISASSEIDRAIRLRFVTAALAGSRVNRPGSTDLHRLWRTPIQRSDTFADFVAKTNGGLRLEGALRSLAARRKYRGATQ